MEITRWHDGFALCIVVNVDPQQPSWAERAAPDMDGVAPMVLHSLIIP